MEQLLAGVECLADRSIGITLDGVTHSSLQELTPDQIYFQARKNLEFSGLAWF